MEFDEYGKPMQAIPEKINETHKRYKCGYCETQWLAPLPKSNCWSCDREIVLLTI